MLEKAEYLTMSKYNKRTPRLIKLESEVKRKTILPTKNVVLQTKKRWLIST